MKAFWQRLHRSNVQTTNPASKPTLFTADKAQLNNIVSWLGGDMMMLMMLSGDTGRDNLEHLRGGALRWLRTKLRKRGTSDKALEDYASLLGLERSQDTNEAFTKRCIDAIDWHTTKLSTFIKHNRKSQGRCLRCGKEHDVMSDCREDYYGP